MRFYGEAKERARRAKNLKALMEAHHITATNLAKLTGYSRDRIYDWQNGRTYIDEDIASAIVAAMNSISEAKVSDII